MQQLDASLPVWLVNLCAFGLVVLLAFSAHTIAVKLLRLRSARTANRFDDIVLKRFKSPSRWLLVAITLSLLPYALELDSSVMHLWASLAGFVVPALIGWTTVALLGTIVDFVELRADVSVADNLAARQRRTRAGILYRIGVFIILTVTTCMILMNIPSVRDVGMTLAASAGIAGLAVGAAAQPALKNLIAGIQMAFTEPIRIDDIVIVNGEWGRIEEIRLTYVAIKLWDERRLIVPVSKFLEDVFENWTRRTSQLLGSVFWYVDPTTDVRPLRKKLEEVVTSNPRWDGRFFNLQVTDTTPEAIQIRALMTAADASTAFDLRCDVREAMLSYLRDEMPQAIVRRRADIAINAEPAGLAHEATAEPRRRSR